jgi:hypothetical protein
MVLVQRVYLKGLGYKTFLKLEELGIEVFFLQEATTYNSINPDDLILINSENAQDLCSLGHHKKR